MSSLSATAHPDIAAAVITLDTTILTDSLTRSVSNGWGSADTGQPWTTSGGGASDPSVNGSKGIHSNTSVNVIRNSLAAAGTTNHRVRTTINLDTGTVTGAAAGGWVLGRVTDLNNYYNANLFFQTSDVVALQLFKRIAAVGTTLSAGVEIAPGFGSGTQFTVELDVLGSTIRARAWATATEPQPPPGAAWDITVTDTDLTTGTQVGHLSRLESGNTNALPVQVQWDNTKVSLPGDAWHVWRLYPDGTRVEVLGSPAYASDGFAVFWDTVLPLDVPVYYEATSDDVDIVLLTSNTITVTGTGQGWLKDPAQPINDLFLGDCPVRACPLDVDSDDTSVSFLRLAQGTFASATGVFPIIDAARSRTVAQTRKARESSLAVLSHTLEAGARVEEILATGRNLFLQLTARYGFGYRTWSADYIAVGDAAEDRPPSANMTWPHRAWALPFGLGRPPYVASGRVGGNGIGVSGATYGDGTASGRTYAQRTATGNTYLMSSRGENL